MQSELHEKVKMEYCCRALVGFLFLWAGLLSCVSGDYFRPCEFPAIYNFGDSNSDTGEVAAAFNVIPDDLDRKKFTHSPELAGRSCDGRLIIDFITEHMKLPYLSAYLDSLRANFRHGANFAAGGSTIRRPDDKKFYGHLIGVFSLNMQVSQFKRFKARSKQLYDEAKTASDRDKLPRPEDFAKALYTFDIGFNDLFFGFKMMSFDQILAEIPDIIDQFASAIQDLYEQGGRAFWIHNTAPLGCLPIHVLNNLNSTPEYIDEHGCVKAQNDISLEFNRQLKERVIKLRAKLPEAAITYVDVHTAKYALTSNAKDLGYVDPFKFWYKVNEHNDFEWCGNRATIDVTEVLYSPSCESPPKYITVDGGHYSQAANKWVANQIVNGSLSDPPIPITQACHRQPSSIDNSQVCGASIANNMLQSSEPEACSQFL